MNNPFLSGLIISVRAIESRVRETFAGLDAQSINWNPQPNAWSIGQCFDHLLRSNEPYLKIFAEVAGGKHHSTLWEGLPILPGLWGKSVLNTVKPTSKRKAKAPRIIQPSTGNIREGVVDDFCKQQPKLVEAIGSLDTVHVDRTIVTSPIAVFITYSLRDALSIVVEHEERHVRQAERVLQALRA